jgi:hypothetical protein
LLRNEQSLQICNRHKVFAENNLYKASSAYTIFQLLVAWHWNGTAQNQFECIHTIQTLCEGLLVGILLFVTLVAGFLWQRHKVFSQSFDVYHIVGAACQLGAGAQHQALA